MKVIVNKHTKIGKDQLIISTYMLPDTHEYFFSHKKARRVSGVISSTRTLPDDYSGSKI